MLLKLDMSKSLDKLSWKDIHHTLRAFGFSPVLQNAECLMTTSPSQVYPSIQASLLVFIHGFSQSDPESCMKPPNILSVWWNLQRKEN